MACSKKLDSWKEIADHLDRSVRTAQRWHKENGMPVHKDVEPKGPVYAWSDELDTWRYAQDHWQQSVKEQMDKDPVSNEIVNKGAVDEIDEKLVYSEVVYEEPVYERWTSKLIQWIAIIGLIIVLMGALWLFSQRQSKHAQLLSIRIRERPIGSVVYVYNAKDRLLLTLNAPKLSYKSVEKGIRPHLLQLGDLDGDGHDDVAFVNCGEEACVLVIYIQDNHGELVLYNSWTLEDTYSYEGKQFNKFHTVHLICGDLTGDGKSEIVTLSQDLNYYPSVLRVFDLEGNIRFTLWHPGRFTRTMIADLDHDQTMEILVSGTNNFIEPGEYSAPILFSLERDWSREGQIDLLGPERTLVAPGCRDMQLCYMTLGKDMICQGVSRWEAAYLRSLNDDVLTVIVGQIEEEYLRTFNFQESLKQREGYILQRYLEEYGLDQQTYRESGLLNVRYYNGQFWQTEQCYWAYCP